MVAVAVVAGVWAVGTDSVQPADMTVAVDLDTLTAAAASGSADFDDIDPSPAVASVVDTSVDFDNLAHGQAAPAGAESAGRFAADTSVDLDNLAHGQAVLAGVESAGRFEDSDWADHKPVVAVETTGVLVADN